VWKVLIFEWILLLETQKNCKNWVWKEKSGELSCVHIWANNTCYTCLNERGDQEYHFSSFTTFTIPWVVLRDITQGYFYSSCFLACSTKLTKDFRLGPNVQG